jgi:DNA-binding response OmpR family regulator
MMQNPTHVLIVDDDEILRASIVDLLTDAGYMTYEAGNGKDALEVLARESAIDVVLSDVKMPGMDGPELLRQIRRQHPEVAVIMLTGYGTIDSAVEAMRDGALNYLLKPTNKRQLLEALQEASEMHEANQQKKQLMDQVVSSLQALGMVDPTIEEVLQRNLGETPGAGPVVDDRFLKFGELMIDRHRLVALHNGKPLELTPTEFEILFTLIQASGRVVTFEEIAFRLQGMRFDRDEARTMLSTHLSNLRGKMREAGCEHYLKNSRGTGYYVLVED